MGSYWEPKANPCARRWGEVRHARQARHERQAPPGPERARHAWCARCATCARCAAYSSRAWCATFGARAECARCACARDSTHRETCRPPPSLVEHPCPSLCLVDLRTAGHKPPSSPSLSKAA
eukprot:7967162-Pyramimonas_sp.AAC.1